MDTKKEAKKYLNKYFKSQYINENDDEFKSLVRLLNRIKKNRCDLSALSNCFNCGNSNIVKEDVYRCKDCNCFHTKNGLQI